MPLDIDKPIVGEEPTITELLERVDRSLQKLVDASPGVRGIEGNEAVPECTIDTIDIPPMQRFQLSENTRRRTLRVTVSKVQRGGATDAYAEISTRDGWTGGGYVIGVGDVFELTESTNSVYIRAIDNTGDDASTPVTITVVQENS